MPGLRQAVLNRTPEPNFMRKTLAALLAAFAAATAGAATQMEELAQTLDNSQFSERVEKLMTNGRFAQALELADIGIKRNSKNAQLVFMKSVALENLGRTGEAAEVLRQLIRSYPEIPEPYNNLAVIEAGMGNLEGAKSLLSKALQINPNFALARKNLGDVYLALAIESYEAAAPELPKNNVLQSRLKVLRRLTSKN